MNIKNKEIFIDSIKAQNNVLSDNMIDAISLILCLVKNDISASEVKQQALDCADNIANYIHENKIKTYNSYDLILAALNNNVTVFQKEFIQSLIHMNQQTKTIKPAKIAHKKLIFV